MKRPLRSAILFGLAVLAAQPLSAKAQSASAAAPGAVALTPDQRARFLAYVEHHRPPFSFIDSYGLRIGQVIPDTGISYYRVPRALGIGPYRYTVINNQVVIVDPKTHRVLDLID